jgi:hypothetical protein
MSAVDKLADAIYTLAEAPDSNDNAIARALQRVFESTIEVDRNFDPANVVDGLFAIARGLHRIADVMEEPEADREHRRTTEALAKHDSFAGRDPKRGGVVTPRTGR